ncbi:hypothetical protein EMIHUDRAFT_214257 [Emiliania huxleyi CCMP1516]|uniref:Choloylglycine hydrolase/NAAA C-terminal domain-containing protein n=2 Tax=Emiliania huxleyi TaxID=2903 RepID=A0A0D3IKV4_EMIH1|nr:hypothetical protein EMIHUDRAFT_214257 [Emiliania huxleyi CCMP1516]EOD11889.1 hypothetical protein EMIHUDRAFT_214257 [Emiliania huxleyi CCMP1516]|eukprot:XP_005764318.1 hypothetical protein EMIHUDRAFT_214257 [Emiliania huxleyi CCMP1516]
MRASSSRLLVVLARLCAALACSTVHVPAPGNATVIARTMELGSLGGEAALSFRGFPAPSSGSGLAWRVAVHRRGEEVGKAISLVCDAITHTSWITKLGYVSVDVAAQSPFPKLNVTVNLASDGINEAGLTVSEHTLRQSVYADAAAPAPAGTSRVCFAAFTAWLLGNVATVRELREEVLPRLRVVGPVVPLPSGDLLHWTIDDEREHQVGAFTNDPDFTWHLRNLNNFANLSPDWPKGGERITVQSEVGALPHAVGHGFNLLGLPGDASPPSRFVRLFFQRQYAVLRAPPASLNESLSLAIGLLSSVFISQGTVASASPAAGFELTQYSVLKLPAARQFLFRDYASPRWRRVRLGELDFAPRAGASARSLPVGDGTLGVEDVTAKLG